MNHPWRMPPDIQASPELWRAVGGHPLVADILARRGFDDPGAALAYLDPEAYSPSPPTELPGMVELLHAIERARRCGATVRIWGDLDADGETSTALLAEALAAVGVAVDWAVPRRNEGHGLKERTVRKAAEDGIHLLITCDTGVTDVESIALANTLGLQVAVTDHHDLPPALPDAVAVVNPKRLSPAHPLYELSGVGVAYLVARALGANQDDEALHDLVAIGLIADMARQVDDVRYLIQCGLDALRHTQRLGLAAMARQAGIDLAHADHRTVGYALAPRMNAAGRLADANDVVRLLLTQDPAEADALAAGLEALNRDRQARTEALTARIQDRLSREPELQRQRAIVVDGEGWEVGVLGLVATRLVRDHARPVVLISRSGDGAASGSARSVEGIDIHAAIASQESLLLRQGGHPMAAGFSMDAGEIPAFRQGILRWLEALPPPEPPAIDIDGTVHPKDVDLSLAEQIARLAPFGVGNPEPTLLLPHVKVVRIEDVSSRRQTPHRRVHVVRGDAHPLSVTWFSASGMPQPGDIIDIAVTLGINRYRGRAQAQLLWTEWRPSEGVATAQPLPKGGIEIVDWRGEDDWRQRLLALRAQSEKLIGFWAEGELCDAKDAGLGVARHRLPPGPVDALVVLTPPPDRAAMQAAMDRTSPRQVILTDGLAVRPLSPRAVLRGAAGMLKSALSDYGGRIDLERMAAHLGVTDAAIALALRIVAPTLGIRLDAEGDTWRAQRIACAAPSAADDQHDLQRHRDRLRDILREIVAYRDAYRHLPGAALVPEATRRDTGA